MAYVPTNWQDFPNLSTPITAARLNNMETGISNALTTGMSPSAIAGYPSDATKVLRGDGTWGITQFDYAQITSPTASITATTEGTAVTVITGNSVVFDGTAVMVEFYSPVVTSSSGTNAALFVFYRDSTVLGRGAVGPGTSTNNTFHRLVDTPSAGAHVYKVACYVTANSVIVSGGPGGSGNLLPAFLRVARAL